MACTVNSTVAEILGGIPNAKGVLEKYIGRPVTESELSMAMGMSLQVVAGYVAMSQDKLTALVNELNS